MENNPLASIVLKPLITVITSILLLNGEVAIHKIIYSRSSDIRSQLGKLRIPIFSYLFFA